MTLHSSLPQYRLKRLLAERAVVETACTQRVCLITDWHDLSLTDRMVAKLEYLSRRALTMPQYTISSPAVDLGAVYLECFIRHEAVQLTVCIVVKS